jgi:hypothetical protein
MLEMQMKNGRNQVEYRRRRGGLAALCIAHLLQSFSAEFGRLYCTCYPPPTPPPSILPSSGRSPNAGWGGGGIPSPPFPPTLVLPPVPPEWPELSFYSRRAIFLTLQKCFSIGAIGQKCICWSYSAHLSLLDVTGQMCLI